MLYIVAKFFAGKEKITDKKKGLWIKRILLKFCPIPSNKQFFLFIGFSLVLFGFVLHLISNVLGESLQGLGATILPIGLIIIMLVMVLDFLLPYLEIRKDRKSYFESLTEFEQNKLTMRAFFPKLYIFKKGINNQGGQEIIEVKAPDDKYIEKITEDFSNIHRCNLKRFQNMLKIVKYDSNTSYTSFITKVDQKKSQLNNISKDFWDAVKDKVIDSNSVKDEGYKYLKVIKIIFLSSLPITIGYFLIDLNQESALTLFSFAVIYLIYSTFGFFRMSSEMQETVNIFAFQESIQSLSLKEDPSDSQNHTTIYRFSNEGSKKSLFQRLQLLDENISLINLKEDHYQQAIYVIWANHDYAKKCQYAKKLLDFGEDKITENFKKTLLEYLSKQQKIRSFFNFNNDMDLIIKLKTLFRAQHEIFEKFFKLEDLFVFLTCQLKANENISQKEFLLDLGVELKKVKKDNYQIIYGKNNISITKELAISLYSQKPSLITKQLLLDNEFKEDFMVKKTRKQYYRLNVLEYRMYMLNMPFKSSSNLKKWFNDSDPTAFKDNKLNTFCVEIAIKRLIDFKSIKVESDAELQQLVSDLGDRIKDDVSVKDKLHEIYNIAKAKKLNLARKKTKIAKIEITCNEAKFLEETKSAKFIIPVNFSIPTVIEKLLIEKINYEQAEKINEKIKAKPEKLSLYLGLINKFEELPFNIAVSTKNAELIGSMINDVNRLNSICQRCTCGEALSKIANAYKPFLSSTSPFMSNFHMDTLDDENKVRLKQILNSRKEIRTLSCH